MKKLSNIKELGRYQEIATNKKVNVKKGYWGTRGVDLLFYLYRGTRIFINDADFYGGKFTKIL